ncbi:acyltransferase [Leptospira sp. id769339]|nr:acyltransferase [Leptospira sp. id769339]
MVHKQTLSYRPDIDGLRAIAILAVVIFHTFPSVITGGFVGVDVFFVISGYLISGIILKNLKNGTFTFTDFYSRRIRRILPALLVVLIFCIAFGYFTLLAKEYELLGKHVYSGALFVSNFSLLREFTDYFDTNSELKPLLHLWSLGIEEQFYIVWPLLLFFAYKFRFRLLGIILLAAFFSFCANIYEFRLNPLYTFYWPQTRFWELLFGSTIAWFDSPYFGENDKIASFLRNLNSEVYRIFEDKIRKESVLNILSTLGLIFIILSVFFFDKDTPFPGYFALGPVIGSALMIYSGPNAFWNQKVLSSKFLIFIGNISFPLYLWHWPLLSFAAILEGGDSPVWIRIFAILLSFMFSVLTWHFVEKNIRFREHRGVTAGLLVTLLFVAAAGYIIRINKGFKERVLEYEENAKTFEYWIESDPFCQAKYKPDSGKDVMFCLIRDSTKDPDIVLIGDSHANALAHGLMRRFSASEHNFLQIGWSLCPPFIGAEVDSERPCGDLSSAIIKFEKNPKVKKILLNSRGPRYLYGTGYGTEEKNAKGHIKYSHRPDIADPKEAFREAMRDTLRRLTSSGKEVVFITDVPEIGFNPKKCVPLRPFNLHIDDEKPLCRIPRKDFDKRNSEYHELVKDVLREFPSVKLWEPWKYFCDDQWCSAFSGETLLYRDSNHISLKGSYWLAEKYHFD